MAARNGTADRVAGDESRVMGCAVLSRRGLVSIEIDDGLFELVGVLAGAGDT
jgi:hypothetical protein